MVTCPQILLTALPLMCPVMQPTQIPPNLACLCHVRTLLLPCFLLECSSPLFPLIKSHPSFVAQPSVHFLQGPCIILPKHSQVCCLRHHASSSLVQQALSDLHCGYSHAVYVLCSSSCVISEPLLQKNGGSAWSLCTDGAQQHHIEWEQIGRDLKM